MSQKVSNASKINDPFINGFIPNYKSSYLHICDHSIVTSGIREKYIGFSNTSCVDSLDRFRRSVVDNVKSDIFVLQKGYDSK